MDSPNFPYTQHGIQKLLRFTARTTIVPFTPHGNKPPYQFSAYTACITQIYIRLLAVWVNKTVPPAMHGLVKFSINFLLHGLTHHLRVHRTDYRNCSVSTVRNINVLFTSHGLPKVNFNLHRMEITEPLHITFRFHRTDYRNCSVYTARNTIEPFTPNGLPKVNFHLHCMEITELFHITFRFHRTDYRNCSVYTARNTIEPFTPNGLPKVNFHLHCMEIAKSPYHFPFSPHGLPKLLRLHRTEYNCAIYTGWLKKS